MKKVVDALKSWLLNLGKMWYSIVISCGIWSILLYLWNKGTRGIAFAVMNYLTGALLSVEGDNFIGGIIGRTIILMVFNTLISSLFMHKGNLKTRFAFAKHDFRKGLKNVTEYTSSFALFLTKKADVFFAAFFGFGISLIINAFISGNGEFINSFSCIALFTILLSQFANKKGFIVAIVNLGARKLGYQNICGEAVQTFLSGLMIGCLVLPIMALCSVSGYAYMVGVTVAIAGLLGLLIAKRKAKSVAAILLLGALLVPSGQVLAEEAKEMVLSISQGTLEEMGPNGTSTLSISDIVVNGVNCTDEKADIRMGDVASFKVTSTNDCFFGWYNEYTCKTCGTVLQSDIIQLPDGNYVIEGGQSKESEVFFENMRVSANGFDGDVSGTMHITEAVYTDAPEVVWNRCHVCNPDGITVIDENYYSHVLGTLNLDIKVEGMKVATYVYPDAERGNFVTIAEPQTKIEVTCDNGQVVTLTGFDTMDAWFVYGYLFKQLVISSYQEVIERPQENTEIVEMPEPSEGEPVTEEIQEEVAEEVVGEVEPEAEPEKEISVPMAITAIATSVACTGVGVTFTTPITTAIESALGLKRKKGELCVNGNVDIPTIKYGQEEDVLIPVNVVGGEDLTWLISAIAITPDDSKLVKAYCIPMGTESAEIKVEIFRQPKEEVTSYIEVAALAVDVNGERYFHETMVEINIE